MKKITFKTIVAFALALLMIFAFCACKQDEPEPDKSTPALSLDDEDVVMIKGESFSLGYAVTFDGKDNKNDNSESSQYQVAFTSDGDVVKVDDQGMITAQNVGDAEVTVTIKDTDVSKKCKISVCDIIVDANATTKTQKRSRADFTATEAKESANNDSVVKNYGGTMGETLFKTVNEGIEKAKENDLILILNGKYSEEAIISKSLTLKGKDKAELKKVTVGKDAVCILDNLTISDENYPSGSDARVYVKTGGSLTMNNCILSTVSSDELAGGYAVFAEAQSKKIELTKNTFNNFRYGVYVSATAGEVKITKNALSNMDVGIGFDIRQENSTINYDAKGEIKNNEYNEVKTKTQFFHQGERYDGDFDYEDNELENASKDQGQTGGSGLTE